MWAGWVIAACIALVALGAWTYRAVEASLAELRAAALKSLLDSEVNALRVWAAEEIGDAERIAREPEVRRVVAELARTPDCDGEPRAKLEALLSPLLREEGDATFNVLAPDGTLLATRFGAYCGLRASPAYREALRPVLEGQGRLVRPLADAERVADAPRLREGAPFGWIAVPVRDARERVIALLAIAQPVDGVLASILRAAQPGESGESFAFDAQGRLLSAEHFGQAAPLAALRGEGDEGLVLSPYRNHRGREVIAAWRWLEPFGMGVALEMEAAEAYAPLRYLSIAFAVVFGALVIAVFAALGSALSVLRLLREMRGGRRLGPYRLLEQIGEGGVANVYRAQHDLLKRPTAVKLLKPARATDEMIARFEREAQLASSLTHPHTVEIFDYGRTRDGLFYYAMEYLDGLTVSAILARTSPLPVARALHLLKQICGALAEAHARGVVHRDVKPENIMVCRYGGEHDFVKILDFGLVKQLSQPQSRDLTRTLAILGTPLYMAPERLRNPADVDARADLYAVGAVAFLMLTGRAVFDPGDDLELTARILNQEPPRASSVAPQPIPAELDLIVTACLEKDRELRPQRAADLQAAFEALAAEHRWTERDAQAWWDTMAAEKKPTHERA